MSIELNQRRRRSAALAAAVQQVINSDLPDEADDMLDKFNQVADAFLAAVAKLPDLQSEIEDLRNRIRMDGEPGSLAINTGFKLPDDEPPPAPLPDSRFSLPSDSPKPTGYQPGPFTLPDGD